VFSREHCGQALVRHPDEGVYLAKFPGKLAPGMPRIGAAEDLTLTLLASRKSGSAACVARFQIVPLGASGNGRVSQVCPRSRERCSALRPPKALSPLPR
jgi:hypothetical protein